ncbi:MAG: hypothetical protein HY291_20745 [Planctomycetes bacterium]|nr:hypothetical protein [Planctomycetota bacterium]
MISVKNTACAALLLSNLAFLAPLRASDEKATPEQLQELRAALAEGIAQKDTQLMELAAKGFGAANQKGAALEESVKSAQFEAALQMLQPAQRAQLEVWALYANAKGGVKDALKQIVEFTGVKIDGDAKAAMADRVRMLKLQLDLGRAANALKALSLLKYEGAAPLARVWLAGGNGNLADLGYFGTDALLKACADCLTAADRDAGLKELEGIVADAKYPFYIRASLCRVMTQPQFTGTVMEQPPEDVKKRFGEKIGALVDAMDQNTDAQLAAGLLNTAMQLKLDSVVKKFEEFANTKASPNTKQMLQMYMRFHPQTQAVKPPPAPEKGDF